MVDAYSNDERRVVAALLLDWYSPADRLLAAADLRQVYGLDVDEKRFGAIIADLHQRGIVMGLEDKDGASAIVQPGNYKAAHSYIMQQLGNPKTFGVSWQKEEITSEAAAPTWFPVPNGWKWLRLTSERPFDPSIFDPAIFDTGEEISISSVDWTGVERRLAASPDVVAEIARRITDLDAAVEKAGLTNTERAKAKAITAALQSLVESPEPEWRAIVALLSSPTMSAICNVLQLGGALIALLTLITAG